MQLKDYLNKYRITKTEFAQRAEVPSSALWHYLSGRYKPNQRTAQKIEAASDGLVTVLEQRGKDDRLIP